MAEAVPHRRFPARQSPTLDLPRPLGERTPPGQAGRRWWDPSPALPTPGRNPALGASGHTWGQRRQEGDKSQASLTLEVLILQKCLGAPSAACGLRIGLFQTYFAAWSRLFRAQAGDCPRGSKRCVRGLAEGGAMRTAVRGAQSAWSVEGTVSTGSAERRGCRGWCQYARGLGGTERTEGARCTRSGKPTSARALSAHSEGAASTGVGLGSPGARGVRRAGERVFVRLGWEVCVGIRCLLEAVRTRSPSWHLPLVPISTCPTRVAWLRLRPSLPDSFHEESGDQRKIGCARGRRETTEPGAPRGGVI